MSSKGKGILLTGIRASSDIHLGNYLGAMKPAIERQGEFQSHFFVADLHALTTAPKKEDLRRNVRSIAAAWLAIGLDPEATILWKQSDVREHVELSYYLACLTSMGLLERAHSYKDAIAKETVVKAGLFYYPVLMAADILLYDSDFVPVGKDQAQHLEMCRDIATFFNETYGQLFKLPQAVIMENVAIVPGVDGRKMSKSYQNGIDPFASESDMKKQIMSIVTDSKGLAESKVPEEVIPFQLYRLIATAEETAGMHDGLCKGGYGYGDAKKELLRKMLEVFGPMRQRYAHWMSHPNDLDDVLHAGGVRAREKAQKMMSRVRDLVGL